jgi:hypothetical protein
MGLEGYKQGASDNIKKARDATDARARGRLVRAASAAHTEAAPLPVATK